MGAIFNELCKGPVLVVDDGINNDKDKIQTIIEKLKKSNLPCMLFESPGDVIAVIPNLLFSNFVILDWNFWEAETDEGEPIAQPEGFKEAMEEKTAELIKSLKSVVLAPVFILTKEAKDTVWSRLGELGISKEDYDFLFVENKETILSEEDKLINTFEEWVKSSPHVYLSKWWSTELISKNTETFWQLYALDHRWPTAYYKSFIDDGEDAKSALVKALMQFLVKGLDAKTIDEQLINANGGAADENSHLQLYKKLVYADANIGDDIKPGDIFKDNSKYYINVRPECDTANRNNGGAGAGSIDDIDMYLIEGRKKKVKDIGSQLDKKYGVVPRESQFVLYHVADDDLVIFDKKKLTVVKYGEWKGKKILRLMPPFVTKIQHSYASYVGRYGTPRYPNTKIDRLILEKLEKLEKESESEASK